MTTLREAAQAALDVINRALSIGFDEGHPGAGLVASKGEIRAGKLARDCEDVRAGLIAALAAPEQTPMTDEQIISLRQSTIDSTLRPWGDTFAFARAVEAFHGIGPARGEGK